MIRKPDISEIYSTLLVLETLSLIAMIKHRGSNKWIYIKEYVETSVVMLLLIAHVGGIMQTAIGLYTDAFMCTLFCLVNFGVIFMGSSDK